MDFSFKSSISQSTLVDISRPVSAVFNRLEYTSYGRRLPAVGPADVGPCRRPCGRRSCGLRPRGRRPSTLGATIPSCFDPFNNTYTNFQHHTTSLLALCFTFPQVLCQSVALTHNQSHSILALRYLPSSQPTWLLTQSVRRTTYAKAAAFYKRGGGTKACILKC